MSGDVVPRCSWDSREQSEPIRFRRWRERFCPAVGWTRERSVPVTRGAFPPFPFLPPAFRHKDKHAAVVQKNGKRPNQPRPSDSRPHPDVSYPPLNLFFSAPNCSLHAARSTAPTSIQPSSPSSVAAWKRPTRTLTQPHSFAQIASRRPRRRLPPERRAVIVPKLPVGGILHGTRPMSQISSCTLQLLFACLPSCPISLTGMNLPNNNIQPQHHSLDSQSKN